MSLAQIQSYLQGKPYTLPAEIIELYKWRNGRELGSFFISAEGGYSDQQFYSLGYGLGLGEEWETAFCPGTPLLVLFAFDGTHYWTVLSETSQEFAPIYMNDEPDFDIAPTYPSLTEMLENQIPHLKDVWKID